MHLCTPHCSAGWSTEPPWPQRLIPLPKRTGQVHPAPAPGRLVLLCISLEPTGRTAPDRQSCLWIRSLNLSPPLLPFPPSPKPAYPWTISIRLRGLATARMFTLGSLPGHNPSWGNTFLMGQWKKLCKTSGPLCAPNPSLGALHQPPGLPKSECHGQGSGGQGLGGQGSYRHFQSSKDLAQPKLSLLNAQRTNLTHHSIISGENSIFQKPGSGLGQSSLEKLPLSNGELMKRQS